MRGLEARLAAQEPIEHVHSVASVFVSRIDGMIDGLLEEIGSAEALALRGKAGLANSRLVYQEFKRLFAGERWNSLKGANPQRPLWASTSTKNPDYPDLLYVDNLIGSNTVNTVPPVTLEGILDHGVAASTIENEVDEAGETIKAIEQVGVSLEEVMETLLTQGVEKFAASFTSLFEKIEAKREQLRQTDIAS